MAAIDLRPEPDSRGETSGQDLVLSRLSKRFTDFTAVDGLDLVIPSGSFFALLGPSGCGKTTTLRMIAGLEQPTSGTISIGGRDITGTTPHRRPVNTVFQNYALFPHMSVLDNVGFGLKRRKVRDADAQAKAALELVELGHLGNRRPAQLSGGQQQRVALARAVVNRPAVLLLDEPLGALDMKLRRQMQTELKKIQTEVGLTFVHVTHDQEEAMTMADTVAVMNNGRVEQMGAPQELYELPRTAFVANFLGKSNLMQADVTGESGGYLQLNAGGQHLQVRLDRATDHAGRVLIGIRPEKLRMLPGAAVPPPVPPAAPGRLPAGGAEGTEAALRAVVLDASFSGASTEYLVEVEGIGTMGVFSQNRGAALAAPGDRVSLSWDADHAFGLRGDEDRLAGAGEDGL
ncbi:ABC transporter ATP-binding protein [Arthrobacter sp. APC 3897]|uniref:ABC transporter ATP-binding protein n=1 Tax=Arthrobacter sp. APC 3897 TaxID=3035204 RepID=UPI0025B2A0A8|nr:ABC transporter ATP-binding protein [Arthrobacter sp. APC 3897]MDN3480915.1 ABC transporter ATP-binding protein [Arthrobacter sp. APC 3897]